ncbi:MAG: hypothetical protein JWR42_163 [Marmoricola sp.]|nr:hypothetical protein [Marmoricola sp.]
MTTRTPRVTHAYDGDLVLFMIGMRVHQPWRLRTVGRVFAAMPKMLVELERDRAADGDLGFLGGRTVLDGRGPTILQHWRSVEHLHRFAADPDLAHRPAWRAFYGWAAKAPEAVTIWHETYAVPAGAHESVYVGPARFGLAALDGVVPVAQRGERARDRMAG